MTVLVALGWLAGNLLIAGWSSPARFEQDAALGRMATAAERRPALWARDPLLEQACAELEVALRQVSEIRPTRVLMVVPERSNLYVSTARHVLFPIQVVPHPVEREPVSDLRGAAENAGATVVLLGQPPTHWQVIVLAKEVR